MNKTKKIILIFIMVTFLLGFHFCYAVDLDMTDDLTDNLNLTSNSSD